MPISQSTTVSITQDSVSLDDPELNLSPNYFAFNLSSSPLGPLENITSNLQLQNQNDTPSAQDNINRPRSLPNLSSHSSNVDSLLSPFLCLIMNLLPHFFLIMICPHP
ncbi:hypothetical protein CEXT_673701 [Caerostris extrusa]|uniref:Uncharacterized protein n=1 Tax=Caerostris extrusa TaxID=172846 RepID=A0AAV4XAC5_CAEEX|nr:hypothetical protein CEXT_673701 [Caerostris extrusa]